MSTKKDYSILQFITPRFRASYPHLFTPVAFEKNATEEQKKYEITMLFPKGTDFSKFEVAVKEAMKNEFGPNPAKWPKFEYRKDGDLSSDKEGHAGHWIIKANTGSKFPPRVVDRDGKPMGDSNDGVYGGCAARAILVANAFKGLGGGINFYLSAVQKIADGERFGDRGGDFDALEEETFDESLDDDSDNAGF